MRVSLKDITSSKSNAYIVEEGETKFYKISQKTGQQLEQLRKVAGRDAAEYTLELSVDANLLSVVKAQNPGGEAIDLSQLGSDRISPLR